MQLPAPSPEESGLNKLQKIAALWNSRRSLML